MYFKYVFNNWCVQHQDSTYIGIGRLRAITRTVVISKISYDIKEIIYMHCIHWLSCCEMFFKATNEHMACKQKEKRENYIKG